MVTEVALEVVRAGLRPDPGGSSLYRGFFTSTEHARVREVTSNLIVEGVLMWGLDENNTDPPFISITEYGEKVLDAGEIIPHDPDGFLAKFKSEVPEANDLVIKYLTESVQTFRHNHLLSSTVMLGVASESGFNELFDEMKKTFTNPDKITKFERLEKSPKTKEKFDEIVKVIESFKKLLPATISESIRI